MLACREIEGNPGLCDGIPASFRSVNVTSDGSSDNIPCSRKLTNGTIQPPICACALMNSSLACGNAKSALCQNGNSNATCQAFQNNDEDTVSSFLNQTCESIFAAANTTAEKPNTTVSDNPLCVCATGALNTAACVSAVQAFCEQNLMSPLCGAFDAAQNASNAQKVAAVASVLYETCITDQSTVNMCSCVQVSRMLS